MGQVSVLGTFTLQTVIKHARLLSQLPVM